MLARVAAVNGGAIARSGLREALGYCAMQFAFVSALLILIAATAMAFLTPARRRPVRKPASRRWSRAVSAN